MVGLFESRDVYSGANPPPGGGGIFSRENFIPVRIGFSQSILLCKSHAEWGSFSSGEGKAGGKVFKILTEYTPLEKPVALTSERTLQLNIQIQIKIISKLF